MSYLENDPYYRIIFLLLLLWSLKKKKKKPHIVPNSTLPPLFSFAFIIQNYLRRRGGEIDRLMGRPRRPPRPPRSENGLLLRLRGDRLLLIFLTGLRDRLKLRDHERRPPAGAGPRPRLLLRLMLLLMLLPRLPALPAAAGATGTAPAAPPLPALARGERLLL